MHLYQTFHKWENLILGTAGIWTQDLVFTRQALWPAKPQRLNTALLFAYENSNPIKDLLTTIMKVFNQHYAAILC